MFTPAENKMAAVIISRRLRRSLRRQRVFRDRRNPLDSFSDGELYEAFRFHRTELLRLFDDLAIEIEYVAPRHGSLPVPMQVCLLLITFICHFSDFCVQYVSQCVFAIELNSLDPLDGLKVFSMQESC